MFNILVTLRVLYGKNYYSILSLHIAHISFHKTKENLHQFIKTIFTLQNAMSTFLWINRLKILFFTCHIDVVTLMLSASLHCCYCCIVTMLTFLPIRRVPRNVGYRLKIFHVSYISVRNEHWKVLENGSKIIKKLFLSVTYIIWLVLNVYRMWLGRYCQQLPCIRIKGCMPSY